MTEFSIGQLTAAIVAYWIVVVVAVGVRLRRRFPVQRRPDGSWSHFLLIPYPRVSRVVLVVFAPPLVLLVAWLTARG